MERFNIRAMDWEKADDITRQVVETFVRHIPEEG